MALLLSSEKRVLENEVQISYFVRKRHAKSARIGYATLMDISSAGLCMEISPLDSELYMETLGQLFLLNRNIDIQIFCRSHPSNVSIEGRVTWIKRREEADNREIDGGICVGVAFSFETAEQRRELANLVELLRGDTFNCAECGSPVSVNAGLCYRCGARLARKRTFFRKIIFGLLAGNSESR